MPVLAIGGDHSLAGQVAQMMQPLANDVQSAVIERCGHWVAGGAAGAAGRVVD